MNNEKGQSLIDVIFSVSIVVLILTSMAVLAVNTTKSRRMTFERQKATELSQKLIESEVESVKTNNFVSWFSDLQHKNISNYSAEALGYLGYKYSISYASCVATINGTVNDYCNVVFTINWGANQSLSVQRMFSRKGL